MPNFTAHYNLALLIDIENLIVGVCKMGLPIDIGEVIKKLLDELSNPKMRFRRAFGDIPAAVRQCQSQLGLEKLNSTHWSIRRNLAENLVQIADTPYLGTKNSADMWLTVDALTIAHTSTDIERFAIVSSDRDYIPLILKLRELGKEVIGVGISHEVNPLYVKACDAFYYYSDLIAAKEPVQQQVLTSVSKDCASLRDAYIRLLVQAAAILNRQGKEATGTRLVPLMKQLCPDFDPKVAELNSSKHLALVAEQEGYVKCGNAGMDFVVELLQSKLRNLLRKPSEPRAAGSLLDPSNLEHCVTAYREYFAGKLAIEELPDADIRGAIFHSASVILGELDSVSLCELSDRVANLINPALAPQKTVFKVLYSLYRGGAFSHDLSITDSPYNPRITESVIERENWDECFVRNCLHVLAKEKPEWPIVPVALAEVFAVTTEQIEELISRPATSRRSLGPIVPQVQSMPAEITQLGIQ